MSKSKEGSGKGQRQESVLEVEDPILEVRDLNVAFQMDRGNAQVIDDINVDIDRNEILGIVGESGSGKSMFASALLDAVVDPGVASGEVKFHSGDGNSIDVLDLSEDELREFRWDQAAMVFQGAMSSFNPVRKIRKHFVETLVSHDYNVEEGLDRAADILSSLYLDPETVLNSYPHELSGGMRQRALIALSLILEPEMLIMDEPTASLDLLMQRSIIGLIKEIKQEYDLTIVFITHDLQLVAELADRMGVMYAFEFVELGPTDEIINHATHPYSRALINSTPNLMAPLDDMKSIVGESPDPVEIPDGCSYHVRCPMADEQCRQVDPGPYSVNNKHISKCHYWEEAENEIPAIEPETDSELYQNSNANLRETERDALLSLDDIEVHFEEESGGFFDIFSSESETVSAVDGVSLDIYERDVVVLVGESGCGKTTLGKTAVGLQRPTKGTVEYRGQDIWQARSLVGDIDIPYEEIRHSLQIIHQDPGSSLNSFHRINKILEEPLIQQNSELDENERRERILGMLEYIGMRPASEYIDRYPFQLSGGEQQRVAMLRAFLMNPEMILADEPISALDVSLRVEMMDLMLDLQDQMGTSFLFVSHNLANARYISEKAGGRIAVMYLGEIVEIGPPERIISDPRHPYTQALKWATPELKRDSETEREEQPLREIDIPDPINPPSGCRFHTRCPEAREVCRKQTPAKVQVEDVEGQRHRAACFREYNDHEYWNSASIVEEETSE